MNTAVHTYATSLCHVADTTAGERLAKLFKDKGFGVRSLARKARVAPGTIGNMTRKGLSGSTVETVSKVADALGVSITNLRRIDSGLEPISESALAKAARYQVHPNWIQFPVYGSVSAGDPAADPIEDDVAFIPREHLQRRGTDEENVRTYIVNGRCMLSPEAMRVDRTYAPGDYIAVDLGKHPEPGDVVVAWWDDEEMLVIKRYGLEEHGIVLTPIAPGRPSLVLPEDADIAVLGPVFWRGG